MHRRPSLAKRNDAASSKILQRKQSPRRPCHQEKIRAYLDLLLTGEHVVLDVDLWLMFLRLIASSPEKEKFWDEHKEVASYYWEQLKIKVCSPEEMLSRLKVCNFYRLTKNAPNDYTGVLVSGFLRISIEFFLRNTLLQWGLRLR